MFLLICYVCFYIDDCLKLDDFEQKFLMDFVNVYLFLVLEDLVLQLELVLQLKLVLQLELVKKRKSVVKVGGGDVFIVCKKKKELELV